VCDVVSGDGVGGGGGGGGGGSKWKCVLFALNVYFCLSK